jgi:putative ubiquitin-RnfH superfamily antitoxin RatB of RatAB toxin-antitoxin module
VSTPLRRAARDAGRATAPPAGATIRVSVVWATASVQDIVPVELPAGSIVAQAVAASGLLARYAVDARGVRFAIGGRIVPADATLAKDDRVEICRPLAVDPKEARRLRAGTRRRS